MSQNERPIMLLCIWYIIETRKLKRKQIFAAFIDFRKAYDSIKQPLLWTKLEDLGVGGTFYQL